MQDRLVTAALRRSIRSAEKHIFLRAPAALFGRHAPQDLRQQSLRAYFTMKQKCVLAQTFLRSRQAARAADCRERGISPTGSAAAEPACVFYHEAKMCACTDIFAKPSGSTRGRLPRKGHHAPQGLRQQSLRAYYNIFQVKKQLLSASERRLRHFDGMNRMNPGTHQRTQRLYLYSVPATSLFFRSKAIFVNFVGIFHQKASQKY